jgi:hypothetical protein
VATKTGKGGAENGGALARRPHLCVSPPSGADHVARASVGSTGHGVAVAGPSANAHYPTRTTSASHTRPPQDRNERTGRPVA